MKVKTEKPGQERIRNIMKTLNQLMQDIIQLTAEIETRYPELYKYLNETPLELCETRGKVICTEDLKDYLETLRSQLKHHIETHRKQVK